MNRWKLRRNTSRLILVLACLLTLIVIVMTGVSSYAITPDGAYIGKIQGIGLTIGDGNSRDRTPVNEQQQLRPNTILYVPGNRSWANLGFFEDSPKDHTGLLVQAGPSKRISEWSFPCSAKGRLTIAWKEGSKRGCEEGVKVQSSSKKSGLPNNNLQASRKLLAQAEDEVTVVPTPGQSTIQTADTATGIKIDVLVGEVQVKSAKNPGGRLVKAGERYDYPQDTITPSDTNPIVNSPEMQDFLNSNNWSSPNIPQRVADGFSEQLGEMQTALNQLPQRTATSQSTQPQRPATQFTQSNIRPESVTSNKEFVLEGKGIDICLSFFEDFHKEDCGYPAATYFCQQQGYSDALTYSDSQIRLVPTTTSMRSGEICSTVNDNRCYEFTRIVCVP
ncbi:hypothetical protein QUB00_26730 [Microcoleus sp. F8_C2]